ncbi:MAG: glutamyl-tRNA reductase [Eubacteriales bacterium]|nr:glutamyl-tRNA reductase [Eubacteriales bacterium]
MSISMIGIDHNSAKIDDRARYAFTKKEVAEALETLKKREGVKGCIILSTCNRMEMWISGNEFSREELYTFLCELKKIEESSDVSYFSYREGEEAVQHLFYLTSGLKSQILGEDQILTQVKDSLNLGRENFATDNVLEVLFRMAVTVGKKIKTDVPIAHGNPSVIHQALKMLHKQGYDVSGKCCMVIGNGEMGKVAAQTLQEQGADVTVTVRQYRSGIVNIPLGCKRINYGERMEYFPQCDLVVSATASPNFTLRTEHFENLEIDAPKILIDLAVPRDIDPQISEVKNITLYDMDSFRESEADESYLLAYDMASKFVKEQLDEFYKWYDNRDVIPRIQDIKAEAVHDFTLRTEKILKNTQMDEEDRIVLKKSINDAAGKIVNKLIFGLRDSLKPEAFLDCVEGLEKLYED